MYGVRQQQLRVSKPGGQVCPTSSQGILTMSSLKVCLGIIILKYKLKHDQAESQTLSEKRRETRDDSCRLTLEEEDASRRIKNLGTRGDHPFVASDQHLQIR